MPNRIIRDGFISSVRIDALSMGAEVFYHRLLLVVDDYGRYHGSIPTLLGACWPTHPSKIRQHEVSKWLTELITGAEPLVKMYNVKGFVYLEVQDFQQRVRSASKFPPPPWQQSADKPLTNGGEMRALGEGVVCSAEAKAVVPAVALTKPLDEAVEILYSRHPKKKDKALVGTALLKVLENASDPNQLIEEISLAHVRWCRTEDWTKENGRYCPKLAEWISDRGWTQPLRLPGELPPAKRLVVAEDPLVIEPAPPLPLERNSNADN